MIGNPFQPLIDWLSQQFDRLINQLNPINIVMALAGYFASFLPDPDPRVTQIVNDAVSALGTFVKYIGLADYLLNLPVMLIVIGIILAAETLIGLIRAWRLIRSFVV